MGYGIVTGQYEYRPERTSYRNVRRVRWERSGNWKCKSQYSLKNVNGPDAIPDTVRYLTDLIGRL